MSKRYLWPTVAVLAFGVLMEPARAQFDSQRIRGEVSGVSDYRFVFVEVYDSAMNQMIERTMVGPSGEFDIRAKPGNYDLRVTTARGDVLARAPLRAFAGGGPIRIQVPEPPKASPVSGIVSARDLERQNNKRLMARMAASDRAASRGDWREFVSHLEQAVAIDPTFARAYVNLGTGYVRLGLPASARAALLRAIELEPALVVAYTNLAASDFTFGDIEGASAAASEALRLAPEDATAKRIMAAAGKQGFRELE